MPPQVKNTQGLKRFLPQAKARTTKRIIREFAERSDMVYFGYVSQRDDDHHIVRGATVSTKHHDDHYCIGTYDTYDTVFVERTDSLPGGKTHSWHIIEIDLKRGDRHPHTLLLSKKNHHGLAELVQTKFPTLHPFTMHSEQYPVPQLDKLFTTYVSPAYIGDMMQRISAEHANVIGSHFDGLDIEIHEGSLYIYSDKSRLSAQLLTTMLLNGIWLAKVLDS